MKEIKIKDYSTINESTKANYRNFKNALKEEYKDLVELNLTNKDGNKFLISPSYISKWEEEFHKITSQTLLRREANKSNYLNEGYIVSEINSSLKAEGVHSSRKLVEQKIKDIKEGVQRSEKEIDNLILNYYNALKFILESPEINQRNLYHLYSTLTMDIKNGIIEEESFFRKGEVSIGYDNGFNASIVKERINELIVFIKEDHSEIMDIHTKAIIAHYIFENIHPYYDFNGRIGRILHLWILINQSFDNFWELIYLSEAIFSFKNKFDTIFSHILKAKNNNANIDLNYFIGSLYEIFIKHSYAYIEMKSYVSLMKVAPSRFIRLFIIDMICQDKTLSKWYTMLDFRKIYPDYSPAMYGKILNEIEQSGIFKIQEGKPKKFKLKKIITTITY